MNNIRCTVLYLSLIYPQNGCEKIDISGPVASTHPISVPFKPLNCKYRGRKLKMIVFAAWKLKSNVFNGNNECFSVTLFFLSVYSSSCFLSILFVKMHHVPIFYDLPHKHVYFFYKNVDAHLQQGKIS